MTTPHAKIHTQPATVTQGGAHTAPLMYPLVDGSAPTYSAINKNYYPSPNLATLIFHAQGAFTTGTSPPLHVRYPCCAFQVAANLGTYANEVSFVLYVNAVNVGVFFINSHSMAPVKVVGPPVLVAYTDLITVGITDIGSGNSDLVVHVELTGSVGGES